jgi:hypothetical protein
MLVLWCCGDVGVIGVVVMVSNYKLLVCVVGSVGVYRVVK